MSPAFVPFTDYGEDLRLAHAEREIQCKSPGWEGGLFKTSAAPVINGNSKQNTLWCILSLLKDMNVCTTLIFFRTMLANR